jgi:hypothetical protein
VTDDRPKHPDRHSFRQSRRSWFAAQRLIDKWLLDGSPRQLEITQSFLADVGPAKIEPTTPLLAGRANRVPEEQ